jgi:biopolymer transport protein ExbD
MVLVITSLIIVFFLLPLFTPSGEVIPCSRSISLPVSHHGQPIGNPGPVISVCSGSISIEGTLVGRADEISRTPEPLIAELAERLIDLKCSDPEQTNTLDIYFAADSDTPFVVLRKVLRTVTSVGFPGLQLAVTRPPGLVHRI